MKKDIFDKHDSSKNEEVLREELGIYEDPESDVEKTGDEQRDDKVLERLSREDSVEIILNQTSFVGVDGLSPNENNPIIPEQREYSIEIYSDEDEDSELDTLLSDEEEED